MSDSKGFDLAALLGGVSKMDTGGEQIVRLPLELLDPDPDNFYSLKGLDELAANIETVGLLDPIRVRPNGERYTVVSGHRRRAAIQMIRDGGSDMFAAGVPCIVEYGEASDAMRKLRLIYANSATRQLTSAELSQQAEEVTRLLYELKEQGVEFPGRMRDHVAEACNTTKSKLARLHAIRSNAQEYILDAYDKGEINESVAYEFQKLDKKAQKMFMVQRRHACLRLDVITAEEVVAWGKLYERLRTMLCPGLNKSGWCRAAEQRQMEALRQLNGYHGLDDDGKPFGHGNCAKGRCCLKCPELLNCPAVHCKYSEEEAKRREAEQERTECRGADAPRNDTEEPRLAAEEQRNAEDGAFCGENETSEPPAAAWPTAWQTGEPEKEGWYATRSFWRNQDIIYREICYWRGQWYEDEKCSRWDKDTKVTAWFPLPEEVKEEMK